MKGKMCFQTMLIVLMTVVLAGAFCVAGAEQEGYPEIPIWPVDKDDYRPGKTDPVRNPARRLLLGQKQVVTFEPGKSQYRVNVNSPKGSLKEWESTASFQPGHQFLYSTQTATAVAAGRVLTPLWDDSFGVSYIKSHGGYAVLLMKYPGAEAEDRDYFDKEIEIFSNAGTGCTLNTVDIATGDIDGVLDKTGETHEEIVIAYKAYNNGVPQVNVAAIKATPDESFSAVTWEVLSTVTCGNIPYDLGFLSLTMGDYNDDGIMEIVVSWPERDNSTLDQIFRMSVLSYDVKKKTLQVNVSNWGDQFQFYYNMVDLASGDFNGNGRDELAAVYSSTQTDTENKETYIQLYEIDLKNSAINYKAKWHADWYFSSLGASITSGFFKFDPDSGYTTARRQIAVAHLNNYHEHTKMKNSVDIFDFDSTCEGSECTWKIVNKSHHQIYCDKHYYFSTSTYKPEIAAGRFHSLDYQDSITDQIAVSRVQDIKGKKPEMNFTVYNVGDNFELTPTGDPENPYGYCFYPDNCSGTDYAASAPMVTACVWKNESYYLGTPVHFYVPALLGTERIIQEPPKHLDYLPDETGKWGIVDASRTRTFFAELKDIKGNTFETSTLQQTNWDIGGSVKITAKQTAKEEVELVEAKQTQEETFGINYDYDSVTKIANGRYKSVDVKADFSTDRDDYLQVRIRVMDIWRFPVYGLKTQEKENGFYEVIMPGPLKKPSGWGCDMADYYQPIHENGNLLSYPPPPAKDETFPTDLGTFQVDGAETEGPMTGDTPMTISSGSGKVAVEWASDKWSSKETSCTHKLGESLDLSHSFKSKAELGPFASASESWKVTISLHNSNSWSETSFSKSTTKAIDGITITLPSDAKPEYAYTFTPYLYATWDGTLKLAHTVNLSGSTQGNFWQVYYHGQPDLSLNLPKKFWWDPNETNSEWKGTWYVGKNRQLRSRMRGLFLLKNEPNEANKGKEQYLAYAPTAGDKIYVQTYVYNYSQDTVAKSPFTVRFSCAPYDPDRGDKAPVLTHINDATVDKDLQPLERRKVYVEWDTTGLGGDEPGTGRDWVIYVTLDPDNEVPNEFHELYAEDQSPTPGLCPIGENKKSKECGIFCGSNNQGYWPWDNSFAIFSPTESEEPETPLELAVEPYSLEVEATPESEQYGDEVFTQVEYRIRAVITANRADQAFREVLFYDNDRIFAMRRLFGVKAGENIFYCHWTPEEAGDHTLIMVVENEEEETNKEDNGDFLDVYVLPFETPIHR